MSGNLPSDVQRIAEIRADYARHLGFTEELCRSQTDTRRQQHCYSCGAWSIDDAMAHSPECPWALVGDLLDQLAAAEAQIADLRQTVATVGQTIDDTLDMIRRYKAEQA